MTLNKAETSLLSFEIIIFASFETTNIKTIKICLDLSYLVMQKRKGIK